MTDTLAQILTLHDKGTPVAAIATAAGVSPGYVYGILRSERPDRARSPRTRTSKKRQMIVGLLARHSVARVAFLCDCSHAYVYKIQNEIAAQ